MTDIPVTRAYSDAALRTALVTLARRIAALRPARRTPDEILQAQARCEEARRAVDRLLH